ncbi:hypothetical protein DL546_005232 [Coniochaeta pulveracea]|uniref:Uncharacterized protein n=1 Tax=Coniochaeta pulveracea TaxID=177199 RepID=A0A420Y0S4_9PEZI|nr:hypothetical protein DL546_005232 [Coniochaeta pulveracea]
MSQPTRFDRIYEQVYESSVTDPLEQHRHLCQVLKTEQERHEFWRYQRKLADEQDMRIRAAPTTRQELINTIDTSKLSSPDVYSRLIDHLDSSYCPWLPIGTDPARKIMYRLKPDPFSLLPHRRDPPNTDRELVAQTLLGVNENVQPRYPRSRRQANYSEESTRSAESDDSSPGFEFFQLGTLEYCRNYEGERSKYLDSQDWQDTGFAVVARLGRGGHRDAICVVADFFPMDPETGERNPIKEGDRWGRPPHPEGAQFSCATIGRRLADMGFNKVLNWENCIKRPVELVWLVRAANQQLLRSTVA